MSETQTRTEKAFPFSFDTSEFAALGKKRMEDSSTPKPSCSTGSRKRTGIGWIVSSRRPTSLPNMRPI